MTDSPVLPDAGIRDTLAWRSRLQRKVHQHRVRGSRHAAIGALLCLALLLGLHGVGEYQQAQARAQAPVEALPVVAGAQAAPSFSAVMVGDLMFGRHVERAADRHGYPALLEHVAPHLSGDYVSGNLEQVVSDRVEELPEAEKIIHLASEPEPLDAMVDAGFTLVTLANNHTMDHGLPGLLDTLEAVEAAGLEHVGAGEDLEQASRVHYEEHGDLTVATVSFTDTFVEGFIARAFQGGALWADLDTSVRLIQQAQGQADLVIAQFHWGDEYDFAPNARQRELAEAASLAGADIIVGHHPHVLMPVEMIGDTVVFWSLGNFVFDQGWSRTRESAIASYRLGQDGMARIELRPIYIREATPRPVEGATGAYRRLRIFQQLRGAGIDWRREGDLLVADIDHRTIVEDLTP